ncbi:MAG: hypothetical protein ACREP9_14955, partial [Candidatus Dormibacteraceae bacterium]
MFKDSGFAGAEVALLQRLGGSNLVSFDPVQHSTQELLALRDRIQADHQKLAGMGIRVVYYGPDYAHNQVDLGIAGLTPTITSQLTSLYGANMLNIHPAQVNSSFDLPPTGVAPTTVMPSALAPATVAPATLAPTTVTPGAVAPTTVPQPTVPQATAPPTTVAQTTAPGASQMPPVAAGQNIVQQMGRATLLCSGAAPVTFAQNGVQSTSAGILLAGHCAAQNSTTPAFQVGQDGTKYPIGAEVADTDNHNGGTSIADSELIRIDDPARALPEVVTQNGQMLPITGIADPVVGMMALK